MEASISFDDWYIMKRKREKHASKLNSVININVKIKILSVSRKVVNFITIISRKHSEIIIIIRHPTKVFIFVKVIGRASGLGSQTYAASIYQQPVLAFSCMSERYPVKLGQQFDWARVYITSLILAGNISGPLPVDLRSCIFVKLFYFYEVFDICLNRLSLC